MFQDRYFLRVLKYIPVMFLRKIFSPGSEVYPCNVSKIYFLQVLKYIPVMFLRKIFSPGSEVYPCNVSKIDIFSRF